MTSTIDQVLLQPLGTIVNPDGTPVIAFKTEPEATLAEILVARAEREEEERREQQRRREQLQDLLAVTESNLNMLQIRHRMTYRRYTELPLRSRGARRIHLETLNALTYNIGETTDQIRSLEEQLAAMGPSLEA